MTGPMIPKDPALGQGFTQLGGKADIPGPATLEPGPAPRP